MVLVVPVPADRHGLESLGDRTPCLLGCLGVVFTVVKLFLGLPDQGLAHLKIAVG